MSAYTLYSYTVVHGADARPYLKPLANLRLTVFREFPYLYDGTLAYEEKYLETYFRSPRSMVILCRAGDEIIGASTAVPLEDEEQNFQAPFKERGINPKSVLYFGESVIAPAYRGLGIGAQFLARREERARALGQRYCAFCAVQRDPADPRRPPSYRSPESLWRAHGYAPRPGLTAQYSWKQLDETTESSKTMQVWLKDLENPMEQSQAVIRGYFEAFRKEDAAGMLNLMQDNVIHEICNGPVEVGKPLFGQFMERMFAHYKETPEDMTLMASSDGRHAAAEYFIRGAYLKTYPGLPEARGQKYFIRVVSIFALEEDRIQRVTTWYNLQDWLRQVQS